MRIEGSVTALSWIPSEAVNGQAKLPFALGMAHYDDAPPDTLEGGTVLAAVTALNDADRFRIGNHLEAWIEVADGAITAWGDDGRPIVGVTAVKFGRSISVAAAAYEPIKAEPEVGDGWVRFRQSAGGRTGVPAPRRVNHPPFVQIIAPTAWTTVELTLHADGRQEVDLVGASPFPRHWLYDSSGALVRKSGMIDFKDWYRHAFGKHSPWGDEDSPTIATEVETSLERELSKLVMHGAAKPKISKLRVGDTLIRQGDTGTDVFLLLDGVLHVDVDGDAVAELGPGAIIGERALIESGQRTSTVTALTSAKVATSPAADIDPSALTELARSHRREDAL